MTAQERYRDLYQQWQDATRAAYGSGSGWAPVRGAKADELWEAAEEAHQQWQREETHDA